MNDAQTRKIEALYLTSKLLVNNAISIVEDDLAEKKALRSLAAHVYLQTASVKLFLNRLGDSLKNSPGEAGPIGVMAEDLAYEMENLQDASRRHGFKVGFHN